MNVNQVPFQLSTLGLIGLTGSILRGYQLNKLDVEAILYGVILQIGIAVIITLIISWFLASTQSKSTNKINHPFLIVFMWTYFALGLFSLLRLIL